MHKGEYGRGARLERGDAGPTTAFNDFLLRSKGACFSCLPLRMGAGRHRAQRAWQQEQRQVLARDLRSTGLCCITHLHA